MQSTPYLLHKIEANGCDTPSGAITRLIADQARTIRIPVHMIETINKLVRTSRQMLHEIGREPFRPSDRTFRAERLHLSTIRVVLESL